MEVTTVSEIYKFHEQRNKERPREYLGWSQIGRPCERELWLAFRWAFDNNFDGRMLRLFDSGHREETRVISELREIGCHVIAIDPVTKKQVSVQSHGGHFRGHLDAQVTGLPEAPHVKHLMDVKTIKASKFEELLKKGMEKMYPTYWAQAHGYMGKLGIRRAVYIFVCKDNDKIHAEFFDFDEKVFEKYEKRAERIIFSDRMPPPISTEPTWYECKLCSAHDLCHGSKVVKKVNCRTCAHSTAERNGTWTCAKYDVVLETEHQLQGCQAHILHPDLVPWDYTPTEFGVVWHTPDGDIANGEPDAHIYESTEIVANPKACALNLGDEFRNEFDGSIVG